MLTVETKRHIDAARQVLVGKVPDPKQQIDQITNALIYKFMNDMDVKAKDAGGKASFFVEDLEPYAWRKLMDPRKGAQERLNMYTEALEKFSTATQLPQLFRDIFRQAFLPYRDPETLNLFLKEIEFFDYNHSEELGNAFEYLLSIMGSQGDAGQFRTPRHIIDFIVDVIDPDKDDKILDPACGTAGFLISAYKHIVEKHDGIDESGKKNDEKPLTHSEKQKLMNNLEGYDISSDMVKLARVNMYLHGNNQPKIYEYDSLSSEERWSDSFDVILANPPFMSPKGGIRPHNKFGVESSRAEVLFVDYIMSHLKQNGRAGIIVPEGIIFQSGKAYKQLRKNLVEDGLLAVISLPAGVFNPYAGVKTSILIFDNSRAKQSKDIIFAKVENDGFDLGAQRRPIAKNDLPVISEILRNYRENPKSDIQSIKSEFKKTNFFTVGISAIGGPEKVGSSAEVDQIELAAVNRAKIADTGDYNLSASRYLVEEINKNQKWPMTAIDDVVDTITATLIIKSSEVKEHGAIPVIDQSQKFVAGYTDNLDALIESDGLIAFGDHTRAVKYIDFNFAQGADGIKILKPKTITAPKYLYYIMANLDIPSKGYSRHWTEAKRVKIPVPPIEVQKQIVEELDSYQKIIDGARQVIENYKPTIKIDPEWPIVKLKDLIKSLEAGVSVNSESRSAGGDEKGVLKTSAVTYGVFKPEENKVILNSELSRAKVSPKKDNIIISRMNTEQLVGASAYIEKDYNKLFLPDRLWQTVRARDDFSMKYLFYVISSSPFRKVLSEIAGGTSGSMKNISKTAMMELAVPLPDLIIQKEILQTIEEMEVGVRATKKMEEIYEQKIKDKITEVWGE